MPTVIQIIKAHLVTIGADGLVMPDAECGCELADFAPCGGAFGECEPGYRGANQDLSYPIDGWAMYRTREAADASLAAKEAP